MKVIILAAGMGSRLRPMTLSKPKAMVKVNGIPIIQRQIDSYIKAGLSQNDIYVVVGYRTEMISEFLRKEYPDVNIVVNHEYTQTNNMYSFWLCIKQIPEDTLIVSNGDCVYDPGIISDLISSPIRNLIACDKGSYSDESMKIIVENERVVHISKKIQPQEAFGNSIDLYKIDKTAFKTLVGILEEIISNDRNLWFEVALDELLKKVEFNPFDISKRRWAEIDNYDDLYEAELAFSEFSLKGKKTFVFDLDGTVYVGEKPIMGTINFIISNSDKYDIYFMSNNTSKEPAMYVEKLSKYGIKTTVDKIITPLPALVNFLKTNGITKIYPIANSVFQKVLKESVPWISFTDKQEECQAVVVAYDTELTYEKLRTASILLKEPNVKFLATHQDVVCPTEHGNIPDIGTIIEMLRMTTGREPDKVFGKPNPELLEPVIRKYNKNELVIVGDRLYTDKVMADKLGVDFILVLSGESKREDVENEEKFPALILKDLSYLESLLP
ncbi:HAD-IIA family hydrolase [Fervidobacterium sp.]